MRQMRYAVALSFLLLVVPIVLAAADPTVTITVTPNPMMMPGKLAGTGTWELDPKHKMLKILFVTQLKGTPQLTSTPATIKMAKWEAQLTVHPGIYNPTEARLNYVDENSDLQIWIKADKNDQKVK